MKNTKRAADVNAEDYDAIYFTGGHGVMFDFCGDALGALTARFYETGRVVSAVCHGPAGLLNVPLSSGDPLVKGKNVTGFSWPEEEAVAVGTPQVGCPCYGGEKLKSSSLLARIHSLL